jgi:hypothetical protein
MRINRFNENQHYLTEPYDQDERFSEIDDDEIKVYEYKIKRFIKVGDGVCNIDSNEIDHEVIVIVDDNQWQGINLDEWINFKRKIDSFIGYDGLESYSINTSKNEITLNFDDDYTLGIY